jgi:hypothetical protein
MRLFVLFLCAALTACASSSLTYAPDGRPAYTLNCSGLARTWGTCYKKAGNRCGSDGYDVLAGGDEGETVIGSARNGLFADSTISRSMLIACKGSSIGTALIF